MNLPHAFRDEGLLRRALTHPSVQGGEEDNQRLEFLGDAVLQLLTSEWLVAERPTWDEGAMSRARGRLVNTHALARMCDRWGLAAGLRVGKGEERARVAATANTRADTFEAVVGAIYLDAGLEAARAAVMPLLADLVGEAPPPVEARSRLLEWCQAQGIAEPVYTVTGTEGPPHALCFHTVVSVAGRDFGPATGHSKRAAAAAAARVALEGLGVDA